MNSIGHQVVSPRILYFGTQGSFSLPPLLALLRTEQRVVGLVIPDIAQQSAPSAGIINLLATTTNDTIIARAHTHAIPVCTPSNLPATLEFELLVVACFPRRLPQCLLNRAAIAALNIHPSWLPAYRGPAPLFWQLRDGLREIGVTLHHMTSRIDAGDILAQTGITLPAGIAGSAADELLAGAGAEMLLAAIRSGDYSGRPQRGAESYQSWPHADDWSVPTSWPVLHAFNFMRSAAQWNQPFKLMTSPEALSARAATDYTHGASSPGAVRASAAGGHEVGFADGWLQVC
ncbi:MAG TPA: formyltransferase family protein [Anaerolineales bacterium]|jgi:methionyl-tRNA formyltransferase|nr:formyltransferase family protein [Anaerolineales bacterium]